MEQQLEQQAASRILAIEAEEGLTSHRLAQEILELVEDVAEQVSDHNIVPGHIKAMVEEDGEFAVFNCTVATRTRTGFSNGWEAYSPRKPVLRISVILVGLPEGKAEEALEKAVSESVLSFKEIKEGSS